MSFSRPRLAPLALFCLRALIYLAALTLGNLLLRAFDRGWDLVGNEIDGVLLVRTGTFTTTAGGSGYYSDYWQLPIPYYPDNFPDLLDLSREIAHGEGGIFVILALLFTGIIFV